MKFHKAGGSYTISGKACFRLALSFRLLSCYLLWDIDRTQLQYSTGFPVSFDNPH
ncbi:hypothetical protein ACFS7Z_25785 [Pontibacter toksunensis]|uniref:Uncharacterized protein n=1 Tax=Pontibacter toksunensis TaxID=1332631 RepID=A0ABW6C3J9_9BACT